MIRKQKLTAIVAVRAGSERVPNKNIKKFNGTTLLDIKLRQLKKINYIDEIIVSSDSKRMLNSGPYYFHPKIKDYVKPQCGQKYFCNSTRFGSGLLLGHNRWMMNSKFDYVNNKETDKLTRNYLTKYLCQPSDNEIMF